MPHMLTRSPAPAGDQTEWSLNPLTLLTLSVGLIMLTGCMDEPTLRPVLDVDRSVESSFPTRPEGRDLTAAPGRTDDLESPTEEPGEEPGETPVLCGDGLCDGAEASTNCPEDCGSSCGDSVCNGEESHLDCLEDCGSLCGDAVCNDGEGHSSCPEDCAADCGDGVCNGVESTTSCFVDCGTDCGDGACNGDETKGDCPQDCGPVPPNDGVYVSQSIPPLLSVGQGFEVQVTFLNTGTGPWSPNSMHFLGSYGPQDNFIWGNNRIPMAPGAAVAPGETYTFSAQLSAPSDPGTYAFQWRLLQDAVEWFGEASESLAVEVFEPGVEPVGVPEPSAPNLSEVVWLHQDVSEWPVTANLSAVSVNGDQICLEYNKKGVWPIYPLDVDVDVVANPWVFIHQDDTWYAATWEWLRPHQTCKKKTSVAGDHIKQAPFNAESGWQPSSGETLYFMVSGLARIPGIVNISERSNLVKVVWP